MRTRPTILIVEDDEHVANMVIDHLRQTVDAEILHARTVKESLELDGDRHPDLLLTDILLPDGNGLDLVRILLHRQSYPILVMTGEPTLGRAVEAMRLGAADLFVKPFDLQRLSCVIKEKLRDHRLEKQKTKRIERLERLVRKVIDERQTLQQRVDLVCRDLVGAYRDLAKRMVQQSEINSDDLS